MTLKLRDEFGDARLRDQGRDDAQRTVSITVADRLRELERQGEWVKVSVLPDPPVSTGWIRLAKLEEVAVAPPPVAIDPRDFYQRLHEAGIEFGADPAYLFAVATVESGLKNVPTGGDGTAFGPFQFTEETWGDLAANEGAALGFTEADRKRPAAQAKFAAIFSARNMRAFEAEKARVPTGVELYLMHLLGAAGGLRLLGGAPGDAVAALVSEKARTNNPKFFRDAATVADVLARVATHLADGYAKASALAFALGPAPPADPAAPAADDPPWLRVAFEQLALDIVEKPGAEHDPDIQKFLAATSIGVETDETPWCAAFVAWCIQNCGDAAVAAGSLKSARAADWIGWGRAAGGPDRGVLAVTRPFHRDASGHVGFVVGWTQDRVDLLGGNQGDALNIKPYAQADVVAWRLP